MKHFSKKILSIFVAALMAIIASLPMFSAFAADNCTVTVTNPVEGDTYKFYKVLDVSYNSTTQSKTYSVNDNFANFFKAKAGESVWNAKSANEKNQYAFDYISNAADIDALARELMQYVNTNSIAAAKTSSATTAAEQTAGSKTVTGFDYGYYLMAPTGNGQRVTVLSLTTVIPNATVSNKSSYPTITKKIKEGNNLVDANSAGIGDTVTYQLNSNVPSVQGYSSYDFIMTDILSSGLSLASGFNESNVTITIGGQSFTNTGSTKNHYKIDTTSNGFTITFTNALADFAGKKDQPIVVTYSATVNANAVVGVEGNPNEIYLTYSHNPSDGSQHKDTNRDEVRTYLGSFQFIKVDASNKSVHPIASFSITPATGSSLTQSNITIGNGTVATVTGNISVTTDTTGKITVSGVKSGTYVITETAAPAGYLALDNPISVTVTCNVPTEIIPGATTQNYCTYSTSVNGDSSAIGDITDRNTVMVKFEILNSTQGNLPTTGSIGTIAFMVGGIIVIAAGVFLGMSKRNRKVRNN